MTLFFTSEINSSQSGENKVELGGGNLIDAKVALQGFYMSYGDDDHSVLQIVASVKEPDPIKEKDTNYLKYKYVCNMYDDATGVFKKQHFASTVYIRSLVIADLIK